MRGAERARARGAQPSAGSPEPLDTPGKLAAPDAQRVAGSPSHASLATPLPTARWRALGTGVVVRVAGTTADLWAAEALVAEQLDAIDRACSRFREDSELSRVNATAGGPPQAVSGLFVGALEVALRAAELTDGDVDPTVGAALVLAGYDRDWELMQAGPEARATRAAPPSAPGRYQAGSSAARATAGAPPSASGPGVASGTPSHVRGGVSRPHPHLRPLPTLRAEIRSGWRTVELDPRRGTVRIARGIALDLGATAKAWAADQAAQAVHAACGCGVLVGLGGDIASAGPAPAGGWLVHVTDDHRSGPHAPGQTVAIAGGGLATSSTAVRRWRQRGVQAHHIIDPARGAPARGPWRTVSVAAADCVDANIATTAALVRGAAAPGWLDRQGLPARLVAYDGLVVHLGGWPLGGERRGGPYRADTTASSEDHPLAAA